MIACKRKAGSGLAFLMFSHFHILELKSDREMASLCRLTPNAGTQPRLGLPEAGNQELLWGLSDT